MSNRRISVGRRDSQAALHPPGAAVWVKDGRSDDVFVRGSITGFEAGKGYVVKTAGGDELSGLRPIDCSLANPDGMTAPDNCHLIHVSEPTILSNMRARFANKDIYTYTGSILAVINPFEVLPVYGEAVMKKYVNRPLGHCEPHSYAMAEEAYRTLMKTGKSQSLVVSGESGAGKTETNKHLMRYLAYRSRAGGGVADLADRILQANPVLEAFGNAKTSRNNNSSRFGKFVKIAISSGGDILGATTRQYLLEKSRVNFQSEGERNYHIFYQLCCSGAQSLGLADGAKSFGYLNQSGVTAVNGIDDAAEYKTTVDALQKVGLTDEQKESCLRIVAGLLQLGNTSFDAKGEEAQLAKAGQPALAQAVSLLGCKTLDARLLTRTMKTGSESVIAKNSKAQAALARDALAKAIYARLFDWLVSIINQTLSGGEGGFTPRSEPTFIGLLDVYGFESFLVNSFEQLCINFANEKLQQFFLRFVFKGEEALYEVEGVAWSKIEYQDNQGCIDLIEKTPTGVLRLLDETCKKPGATDKNFGDAVSTTHKSNEFFMEPRACGANYRQHRADEAFAVRHFAGDVCYAVAGFTDKNNDTLHPDFVGEVRGSANELLSTLFADDAAALADAAKGGGGKKGGSFNSVARRYINDLNQLMADLNTTTAHFVRCIKPNTQLKPALFTASLVLQQLRCSGTIEAVQLMAGGYPTRIPFQAIYDRYAVHMPQLATIRIRGHSYQLEHSVFCETLVLALDVPQEAFQLGKTKVFFRPGKGQVLEELAERDITEAVSKILSSARVKAWVARMSAQLVVQSFARMLLVRVRFKATKQAAETVQHGARTMLVRRAYRRARGDWLEKREAELQAERDREAARKRARETALAAIDRVEKAVAAVERAQAALKVAAEEAMEAARKAAELTGDEAILQQASAAAGKAAAQQAAGASSLAAGLGGVAPTLSKSHTTPAAGGAAAGAKAAAARNGGGAEHAALAAGGLSSFGSDESIVAPLQSSDGAASHGQQGRGGPRDSSIRLSAVDGVDRFSQLQEGSVATSEAAAEEELISVRVKLRRDGAQALTAAARRSSVTSGRHFWAALGVDVARDRRGAIVAFVHEDGAAARDGRLEKGDAFREINGAGCSSFEEVIGVISGTAQLDEVDLTVGREEVVLRLECTMMMHNAATFDWQEYTFQLYSNRELLYESTQPPHHNGEIDLRDAAEVRVIDAPSGGTLEVVCPGRTTHLRCADTKLLMTWQRELYRQLPHLRPSKLKSGWLNKQGESRAAGFRRRYCVLLSSHKLSYYEDEAGQKRKGAVDLTVATQCAAVSTPKGHGFEIATPGRDWTFAADGQEEALAWIEAINGTIREVEAGREKSAGGKGGVATLKEGWAGYHDPSLSDGGGGWSQRWFVATSAAQLMVYRDVGSKECETIELADIVRVERSKGIDYYDFAIDLIGRDKIRRMRPVDRSEMQTWIGLLRLQLSSIVKPVQLVSTLHTGWLEKRPDERKNALSQALVDAKGGGWKARYFVLTSRQDQCGEQLEVRYQLHYYKGEADASVQTRALGLIDLQEAEELRRGDAKDLTIQTEARSWHLRAESTAVQEAWLKNLRRVCGEEVEAKSRNSGRRSQLGDPDDLVESVMSTHLKLQVPGPGGHTRWTTANFELRSDGVVVWATDRAQVAKGLAKMVSSSRLGMKGGASKAEAATNARNAARRGGAVGGSGRIDVNTALGVWLLGTPGWKRLVIILPGQRWTVAADDDDVLEKFHRLLQEFAPENAAPVSELHTGWMEKMGGHGTGWKLRFFVLLSTHQLVYFESDCSPRSKGTIDLKTVTACRRCANPPYNYECAFELVTPAKTYVLCPDDQIAMQEWVDAISTMLEALRAAEAALAATQAKPADAAPPPPAAVKEVEAERAAPSKLPRPHPPEPAPPDDMAERPPSNGGARADCDNPRAVRGQCRRSLEGGGISSAAQPIGRTAWFAASVPVEGTLKAASTESLAVRAVREEVERQAAAREAEAAAAAAAAPPAKLGVAASSIGVGIGVASTGASSGKLLRPQASVMEEEDGDDDHVGAIVGAPLRTVLSTTSEAPTEDERETVAELAATGAATGGGRNSVGGGRNSVGGRSSMRLDMEAVSRRSVAIDAAIQQRTQSFSQSAGGAGGAGRTVSFGGRNRQISLGGRLKSARGTEKAITVTQTPRQYGVDSEGRTVATTAGESAPSSEATVRQGWLEKRGEVNTSWKRRYFLLSSTEEGHLTLRYFKSEDAARTWSNGGAIELFADTEIRPSDLSSDAEAPHAHAFEVVTHERTYHLAAASKDDLHGWLSALKASDAAEDDGTLLGRFQSLLTSKRL